MPYTATELTDLHRQLGRWHSKLQLGRPAIQMTKQGKAAAVMVRAAQSALVDALATDRPETPPEFADLAKRRAVALAHLAIKHLESPTVG